MNNKNTYGVRLLNYCVLKQKLQIVVFTLMLVLTSCLAVFASIDMEAYNKNKQENNLELISIEAKNPTNKGFSLEITVTGEVNVKDSSIVYAYTIFENLIVKNYNISYSGILPTTKTVSLESFTKISDNNGIAVYSTDISEVMPQTFYVYAMLKTPNGESELKSCVLNADTEAIYRVVIPDSTGFVY